MPIYPIYKNEVIVPCSDISANRMYRMSTLCGNYTTT